MDENRYRTIAQEVYDQNQAKNQNATFVVPKHTHNGVDAPRLNMDNIDSGTFSSVGLTSLASEIFTIETFPNVTNILLYGVAADSLGRKATIQGSAFIGNCFSYGASVGSVSYVSLVGGQYSNIIQTSSDAYFDTTFTAPATAGTFNTTNIRVNATGSTGVGVGDYLVFVKDAVNEVATMKIISWTNNTITFQTVLTSPWYITFFLTMS